MSRRYRRKQNVIIICLPVETGRAVFVVVKHSLAINAINAINADKNHIQKYRGRAVSVVEKTFSRNKRNKRN